MAVAAKANIFSFSIPVPYIPASSSSFSSLAVLASNFPHRHEPRPHRKPPSPRITIHASECVSVFRPMAVARTVTTTTAPPPPPRRKDKKTESKEGDAISILNERIRRDYAGKREANSRPAMDSEEADRYIQLVKERQQRVCRS